MKEEFNLDYIKNFNMEYELVELAMKGIFYEVSSYPSPGLVSPVSQGAHRDMDFYTFIDSSLSLYRPLIRCVEVSRNEEYKDNKEVFKYIRHIGKEAENIMLHRTKGVNTHKGMIFLMFIALSSVTRALVQDKNFSNIQHIIKDMTEGLIKEDFKDLNLKSKLTYGEKLYIEYGIDGVRGEVERGLPTVFQVGLLEYSNNFNLNYNDRVVQTLIAIMSSCDDTTILHRHPIEMLSYVKKQATNALNLGGMNTKEGKQAIMDMDMDFIEKRISPGGAADLVAITIFLYEVRNKFFSGRI